MRQNRRPHRSTRAGSLPPPVSKAQTSSSPANGHSAQAEARRLQSGTFHYRELDHGKDIGKSELTIQRVPDSGNFSFSAKIDGEFQQQWESIASPEFEPVSAKLTFGDGAHSFPAFDIHYRSGRVTGFAFARRDPHARKVVDAAIPAGTVDQRIDWATVLASDLETGREFQFNVYDPGSGVSHVVARVGPPEHVRVPAGTFDAYRITYRIEKTGGTETYQVLASTGRKRFMLREEFPDGVVSELTTSPPSD